MLLKPDLEEPVMASLARAAPAALRLHDLTLSYQGHPAVHHLNGEFASGSMTAVIGPNGAGKSSLLHALAGRLKPSGGRIERRQFDAASVPTRTAYLPQQAEIDRSFPILALDLVMLGHWQRLGGLFGASAAQKAQALHALEAVGLRGFERRLIAELSVGQFQRLLFARVMLQDAAVILLDEPFNAIDARTTAELLVLLKRWHGEQRTIIAVLHDMEQVRQHFPQALLLAREAIAWGDSAEVLKPQHLLRTRQMAEAWDEQAAWCEKAVA